MLDASVLVAYLTRGEYAEHARQRLAASSRSLWVPHLVDAEVGHALRRAVLAGELAASRGRAALEDLADLPLHRVAHHALLQRAWALRAKLSFYDGLYVALAERLDLPLLTLDRRLAGAPGVGVQVQVIGA